MRKVAILFTLMLLSSTLNANIMKVIELNPPSAKIDADVMEALRNRQSTKGFSSKELTLQQLSDLLWSANGYNREDKRTAPSAMNRQEIDIYVCMEDGVYRYHPKENQLRQIYQKDVRPLIAADQEYVLEAPVCLLLVADMERFGGSDANAIMTTAYDAGIVSQNVYIYCAGEGLGAVVRRWMKIEDLQDALNLPKHHVIHLNMAIGHKK